MVVDALAAIGLPARFTQTGGRNAAIEVTLEAGRTLLVTDVEDALPWSREEHRGWAVGLYPPDSAYDEGPLAFDTVEPGDLQSLVGLIHEVLRQPLTRASHTVPRGQTREVLRLPADSARRAGPRRGPET